MRLPGGPACFPKTRRTLAVLVLATVAVVSATGFVWANTHVTVFVDGIAKDYTTQASDVASLLREAGVSYSGADLVSPAPGSGIADGDTVVVRHSVPVTLQFGADSVKLDVLGRTVADALVTAGLDPTSGMRTTPAVDAPLVAGMHIVATDLFMRVTEESVPIPFDVEVVGDPALPVGRQEVQTPGVAGSGIRVYQVLVVGGVEGPRFLKVEKVLAPPVTQVVHVGTKHEFRQLMVSRGNAVPKSVPPILGRVLTVDSTAYTPWDSTCIGRSAFQPGIRWVAGKKQRVHIPDGWGIVAVDPSTIPLGSKLFVENYGYAIACDTGGVIKGNKIDVCFWGADLNAEFRFPGDYPDADRAVRRSARRASGSWGGHRRVTVTILAD